MKKLFLGILMMVSLFSTSACSFGGGIYDEGVCLRHGQFLDSKDHTCYDWDDVPDGDAFDTVKPLTEWIEQNKGLSPDQALQLINEADGDASMIYNY